MPIFFFISPTKSVISNKRTKTIINLQDLLVSLVNF